MTSEGYAVGRAAEPTLETDKGSLLAAFAAEVYGRNLQLRQTGWEMCSPGAGEV